MIQTIDTYHGWRAKDKGFNAKIETGFDRSLPRVNLSPQDMGRALLNLINNALYAVHEKAKAGKEGYEPTVQVTTKKAGDKIVISVSDNGSGIPDNIIDKIFQPFFTTRPTGKGTGLGLSLAYDTVTQKHGGTISVESKKGEFTSFMIQIPIG